MIDRSSVELVLISTGTFQMGSGNHLFGESPIHTVTISRPFYLSKFPVTQRIWQEVTGENPAHFRGSRELPVESVSWDDAIRFCNLLSRASNRSVRLPTEAEWEYACRSGTDGEFFMTVDSDAFIDGSAIPSSLALAVCDFAWCDINSQERTHPVGQKRPNPWGLYDIVGNVWEWCQDTWHDDYEGAPSDGLSWSDTPEHKSRRCVRGGAWDMDVFRCRSTYRSYDDRSMATSRCGLRIAVDWIETEDDT